MTSRAAKAGGHSGSNGPQDNKQNAALSRGGVYLSRLLISKNTHLVPDEIRERGSAPDTLTAASAFADQIDLRAVRILTVQHLMPRLGAEMRHIDDGGRVIGGHAQDLARGQRAKALARLQYR